jgi:hypothetical protein
MIEMIRKTYSGMEQMVYAGLGLGYIGVGMVSQKLGRIAVVS